MVERVEHGIATWRFVFLTPTADPTCILPALHESLPSGALFSVGVTGSRRHPHTAFTLTILDAAAVAGFRQWLGDHFVAKVIPVLLARAHSTANGLG